MQTQNENENKQLGRPVNPYSARQIRLKELTEKREKGELKLGRPVVEGSKRQQRLLELEEKRQRGECKRGRPVNGESKRQQVLREREMRQAAGIELKRGRPKAIEINHKTSDESIINNLINEIFEK